MTVPPPFATTPPSGLPDLIEHDACALAAFATRDGRREPHDARARPDLAPDDGPPLRERRRRGRRERPDGRPAPAHVAPEAGARGRRRAGGRRPAVHGGAHLLRQHRGGLGPGAAHRGDRRRARVRGALERRGDRGPQRARAARRRDPSRLLAARLPWPARPAPPRPPACYRAMVQMERELDCHVASFSANDAVYKVQGQPEVIPRFYPEMQEPDFASSRIIAHNRYSTNTYPTFSRVQPFSILGHNGEINTIAQLREQSEQLGLPITHNGSDSQDLNRLLEGLIFEKGLSLLEAVEFALPPILGEVHRLPAKLQDLYVHYREALGPYVAGPRRAGLPGPGRDGLRGGRDGPAAAVVDRDRGHVRGLVRAGHRAGGQAHPRPRAARAGREGGPDHGRGRRAAGARLLGRPARGVPRAPRAAARCPAPRRAPAWPAASSRWRSRSTRTPTTSSRRPSWSSRPSSPRPAGSRATSSSSSSTPTAAPSRSAPSAGTARWARSPRWRCRCPTTSRRPWPW